MKSKSKQTTFASHFLIIALTGILMVLMIQMAKAQENENNNLLANNNQNQMIRGYDRGAKTISFGKVEQKSLARRLWENTSLGYYHQFLGPTASGSWNETYNVFQTPLDGDPRAGRAPLQSFQALNLRHQINSNWAFGASIAWVNGYTNSVTNREGTVNEPGDEFFNARAYVSFPAWKLPGGTLFTTIAYEAPTSVISKEDEMRWGWVLTQSYAFNLPSVKWSAGLMGQIYRVYYKNNVKPYYFPDGSQGIPTQLQTMIISGGPYVNYRFNDRWMATSVVTLDWDQRGVQSGSRDFNNNLPHRARAGLSYFPQKIKYLSSVGVFAQGLVKFRPETTALGADLALRF